MQLKNNKWLKIAAVLSALMCTNLQASPQSEGRWTPVVKWPIIAIHTVLTPQGNVMNFGTDKKGLQGARFFYDVWDPTKGSGANSHNTLTNTLGVDSFCSAAIVMPESGNVLMAGGDTRPFGTPNNGIVDAPVFNTRKNMLSRAANMGYARWYPTATTLANGEILVVGGKDGSGRPVTTPEIYSPQTNRWRSMFGLSTAGYPELYPRQWVAPDGRVFGIFGDKTMYYLNLRGAGNAWFLDKLPVSGDVFQSSSVMYQPGKILHVGGTGARTNDSVIINIKGAKPWVRTVSKPQQAGRSWVDSVVLPTGKVMIVGGSRVENKLNGASFRPEIWDPATERWSLMAPAVKSRLYHSTALLLKDGRVLVAGGGAPGPQTNTNAEIFSPPYLFNEAGLAARPAILSAPLEAPYGSKVKVNFRSNKNISRVTLIKTGAVTHSFNMEQRFIELNFSATDSGLRVNIPSSPNVATPGHYLLHLIDDKGVPSKAHIIRISKTAWQAEITAGPTASVDKAQVQSGSTATIDVVANDTGVGLRVKKPNAWSKRGGSVSLVDNKIVYRSKQGFNGEDTIWYVVEDSQGRTRYSQVNITVVATSSPFPVSKQDVVATVSGASFTIDALANDIGTGLVLQAPNRWSLKGGGVTLANNKIVYKSKPRFTGKDTIWYVFNDHRDRKNTGKIDITVYGSGSSQPPVAITDWASTRRNSAVIIKALANDIGRGLVINTVNRYSAKGASVVIVNNTLRYTPKQNFVGSDSFWYSVKDSQGRTNAVKVVVNVYN